MSLLAKIMLGVFILAWFAGLAAHLYASRFFLPMWASGFKARPEHEGYGRKAVIGYGLFIAAIAAGFAAGGIAELAGGWR